MANTTRLDLRIPNELLEKCRKLAANTFKAPKHHISGKPELTPTLVHLIELGIKYLETFPDTDTDSCLDTLPDNYLDKLTVKLQERLELTNTDTLPDTYLDKLTEYETALSNLHQTLDERIETAISTLREEFAPLLDSKANPAPEYFSLEEMQQEITRLTTRLEALEAEKPTPEDIDFSEGVDSTTLAEKILPTLGIKITPSTVTRWAKAIKTGKTKNSELFDEVLTFARFDVKEGKWFPLKQ